jgi:hypothetical protein
MASRHGTARTLAGRIGIITTGRRSSVVAALAAAMLLPAYAHATTVRLGPELTPESSTLFDCREECPGVTLAQLVSPGVSEEAPASGLITSWRIAGHFGAPRLRVLRPAPEDTWIGDGTSAAATHVKGEVNATSLPIRAGDVIGVDLPAGDNEIQVRDVAPSDSTQLLSWEPALADNGAAPEPSSEFFSKEILVNADVVLAPVVSSVSPTSGSPAGGNAVTIGGLFLDGATSVSFGSTPASSFSVESSTQIIAIAPATAASTVDVHISGPGGSSEVAPADRYTFATPAPTTAAGTAPAVTTNPTPKALIQGGPVLGPANPAVSGFGESAARWRRGRSLPHISSAGGTPVGTTFGFSLNEPATVSLIFTEYVGGRRVRSRCVAVTGGNAGKPKCKRRVSAGSLPFSAHAGSNKVRFQGRLSSAKSLKPGSYAVAVNARDSPGLQSPAQSLSFTIVPG